MKPILTKIEFVFNSGYVIYKSTEVSALYEYEVFNIMDKRLATGSTRRLANKSNASDLLESCLTENDKAMGFLTETFKKG